MPRPGEIIDFDQLIAEPPQGMGPGLGSEPLPGQVVDFDELLSEPAPQPMPASPSRFTDPMANLFGGPTAEVSPFPAYQSTPADMANPADMAPQLPSYRQLWDDSAGQSDEYFQNQVDLIELTAGEHLPGHLRDEERLRAAWQQESDKKKKSEKLVELQMAQRENEQKRQRLAERHQQFVAAKESNPDLSPQDFILEEQYQLSQKSMTPMDTMIDLALANPFSRGLQSGATGLGRTAQAGKTRFGQLVSGIKGLFGSKQSLDTAARMGEDQDIRNREARLNAVVDDFVDTKSVLPKKLATAIRSGVDSTVQSMVIGSIGGAAALGRSAAGGSAIKKAGELVAREVPQKTAGVAALIGYYTLSSADQAYTEGLDSGLTKGEAARYATLNGAVEGGLTFLFGKLGASAEELFSNPKALGIKELVKSMGRELAEESTIAAEQTMLQHIYRMAEVDNESPTTGMLKDAGEAALDVVGPTIVAMGLAEGIRISPQAKDRFLKFLLKPTVVTAREAGVNEQLAKTPLEVREFADEVHEQAKDQAIESGRADDAYEKTVRYLGTHFGYDDKAFDNLIASLRPETEADWENLVDVMRDEARDREAGKLQPTAVVGDTAVDQQPVQPTQPVATPGQPSSTPAAQRRQMIRDTKRRPIRLAEVSGLQPGDRVLVERKGEKIRAKFQSFNPETGELNVVPLDVRYGKKRMTLGIDNYRNRIDVRPQPTNTPAVPPQEVEQSPQEALPLQELPPEPPAAGSAISPGQQGVSTAEPEIQPEQAPIEEPPAPAPTPAPVAPQPTPKQQADLDRMNVTWKAAVPKSTAQVRIHEDGGYAVDLDNGTLRIEEVGDIELSEEDTRKNLQNYGLEDTTENRARMRQAAGSYRLIAPDGSKFDGLGLVRLKSGMKKEASAVLRHELFHMARRTGMLTSEEFQALAAKYAPDATTDLQREERIAKAAELWSDGKFANRISEWIDKLLEIIGFTTEKANKLEQDIFGGKKLSPKTAIKPEFRKPKPDLDSMSEDDLANLLLEEMIGDKPAPQDTGKKPPTKIQKKAEQAKQDTKDAYSDLRDALLKKGFLTTGGIDPDIASAAARTAANAFKTGVYTFAEFVEGATTRFGPDIVRKISKELELAWKKLGTITDRVDKAGSVIDILDAKEKSSGTTDGSRDKDTKDLGDNQTESGPTDDGGGNTQSGGGRSRGRSGRNARKPIQTGDKPAGGRGDVDERVRSRPRRGDRAGAGNYRITESDQVGEGGLKSKYRDNVEAIRTLKLIESENRKATPEEQAKLVKYVGWGGLINAFKSPGGKIAKGWMNEVSELKSLLTPEEHSSAARSTTNAHYTSPSIISAMWAGLEKAGFSGGATLEPGSGIGHFFGLMPDSIMENSKLHAIEMDSLTGRIARQLYQNAKVTVSPFQESRLPDDTYDLAISNVPFMEGSVSDTIDRDLGKLRASLHDYYFAKSLKKVRPGGLVMFITSRYSLDKIDDKMRKYISDRADLLAAIRLPSNAFKKNANTDVVTDIILLRKRDNTSWGGGEAFLETKPIEIEGTKFRINEYFINHPDHVLGKLTNTGTMYADNQLNVVDDGRDIAGEITRIVGEADIAYEMVSRTIEELSHDSLEEDGTPDGGLSVRNGKLYRRDGDDFVEQPIPYGEKGKAKTLDRISKAIGIRDTARKLLAVQISPSAAEKDVETRRELLNSVYDKFVKEYGFINSARNVSVLGGDDYAPLLRSLEQWDEESKKAVKADIFSKRTQFPVKEVTSVGNAQEALTSSLAIRGKIDIDWMTSVYTGSSRESILQELGGLVFETPSGGIETASFYLSGNVRKKLEEAKEAAKRDGIFQRNVDELEKVQPEDIPFNKINPRLGVTWVDPEDYSSFVEHLIGKDTGFRYLKATGTWVQDARWSGKSVREISDWGTEDYPTLRILDAEMNHKPIQVTRKSGDSYVVDAEATAAAKVKRDDVVREFNRWLWDDAERGQRLLRKYNDNYNNIRLPSYDGSHLVLPGMASTIELRPHQKNGIWRIITSGNTLLAHVVGAGKTWTMQGAAMEMRRLGIAKKPMFAIPNHLIQQFPSEFLQLYPGAKLLAATPDDFTPAKRQRLMNKIMTGDYDAIIVPQTSFEKLPVSPERMRTFFQKQIDELEEELIKAKATRGEDNRNYIKELEKAKESLQSKLHEMAADWKKDSGPYFDELGVDALFVDEAHEYKNLWFRTRMGRVPGVQPQFVQKTFDMLQKTEYINEVTNGRGVIFATGTPVANSVTELFTMQRYLQPGLLEDRNIEAFDAWANSFGREVTDVEVSPDGGGFRIHTRFRQFVNLPELQQMFRSVSDVLMADKLDLPRPKIKGDKPKIVEAPESEILNGIVKGLVRRAENIRNGGVKPSEDNMLNVTTIGRKAAIDVRLVDPSAPDMADSKVNQAVENIYSIWNRTKNKKSTQLVWLDLGVPKSDEEHSGGIDLYSDIKAKLVSQGIPANEIAFIHDAKNPDQKKTLFRKFRSGNVRILIANTKRLATGANIQTRLIAAHHIDPPWKPAELEQRDGRIVRQGNQNPEVEIYRYITKGSFDAYMWQTLEMKASAISQLMTGDGMSREMEDVGAAALEYAELKAIASKNPKVMEFVKLKAEVAGIEAEKGGFENEQINLKYRLNDAEYKEERATKKIQEAKSLIPKLTFDSKGHVTIEIDGQDINRTDQADAIQAAIEVIPDPTINDLLTKTIVGKAAGLEFYVMKRFNRYVSDVNERIELKAHFESMENGTFDLGKDAFGNLTRINNHIKQIQESIPFFEQQLSDSKAMQDQIRSRMGKTYPRLEELQEKSKRLAELQAELQQTPAPPQGDSSDSKAEASTVAPTGGYGKTSGKKIRKRKKVDPPTDQPQVEPGVDIKDIGKDVTVQPSELAKLFRAATQIVSPANVSAISRAGARVLRKRFADSAQKRTALWHALKQYRKAFSKMSREQIVDFVDNIERNQPQATPFLDEVAGVIRQELDRTRKEVQSLGDGTLEFFNEHYFPHIWKPRHSNQARTMVANSPMEGSKGFKKRRKIPTMREGVKQGLEPVSWNPLDLVMLKNSEMQKYVEAHRIKMELRANGMLQFVPARRKPKEGYSVPGRSGKPDPLFTVYGPPELEVEEYYDSILVDQLLSFASSIGVKHKRVMKISGSRVGEASTDGTVTTKFGSPESVLVHEIGHQLGFKWGLYDWIQASTDKDTGKVNREWRALADARLEGEQSPSQTRKRYVRKQEEKEAVLLQAYITAPAKFKQLAPTLYTKFEKFLKDHAELRPLLDVKPSLSLGTGTGAIEVPGYIIMGHYAVPEDVSLLINNHLSPGFYASENDLIRRVYGTVRTAGNSINMVQLGFSGFHASFTAASTAPTAFGQGFRNLLTTKPELWARGVGQIAKSITLVGPAIQNIWDGRRLAIAMRTHLDQISDPYLREMAQAAVVAGMRSDSDKFYLNNSAYHMSRTWEVIRNDKNVMKKMAGIAEFPVHAVFAGINWTMKYIMEYQVPYMKLGMFSMMAEDEMTRLGTRDLSDQVLAERLTQVADSIDNRLGQMIYDNVFWQKTMKDSLMLATRSVGWNWGFFREYATGPVIDVATTVKRVKEGDALISIRMAELIGTVTFTATVGAIVNYMLTGEPPRELKDYFFPRTGRKRPDGSDERLLMPTYFKDMWSWSSQPVTAAKHKAHPLIGLVADTVSNEDYYGTEIRNLNEPYVQQAKDLLGYIGDTFKSFSWRNWEEMRKSGADPWGAALPAYMGIGEAPAYITRDPAQKLMSQHLANNSVSKSKTQEQTERSRLRREAIQRLRSKKRIDDLQLEKTFNAKSMKLILDEAKMDPIVASYKRLRPKQALDVFTLQTDRDRAKTAGILLGKFLGFRPDATESSQEEWDIFADSIDEMWPVIKRHAKPAEIQGKLDEAVRVAVRQLSHPEQQEAEDDQQFRRRLADYDIWQRKLESWVSKRRNEPLFSAAIEAAKKDGIRRREGETNGEFRARLAKWQQAW